MSHCGNSHILKKILQCNRHQKQITFYVTKNASTQHGMIKYSISPFSLKELSQFLPLGKILLICPSFRELIKFVFWVIWVLDLCGYKNNYQDCYICWLATLISFTDMEMWRSKNVRANLCKNEHMKHLLCSRFSVAPRRNLICWV